MPIPLILKSILLRFASHASRIFSNSADPAAISSGRSLTLLNLIIDFSLFSKIMKILGNNVDELDLFVERVQEKTVNVQAEQPLDETKLDIIAAIKAELKSLKQNK
ncbi:hypothetical protein BOO93_14705 [Vibrio navarrensis]|nr:hypothetical protein [Vibrio navarrensis]